MITTVTLNAAIDKTYYLDSWTAGAVHRVPQVFAAPGGKGLNVAKVVRALGEDVTAAGIAGGHNGAFILDRLTEMDIAHDFVLTRGGESRICLNVVSSAPYASTEFLEAGPLVSPEEIRETFGTIERLAGASKVVVLSGSLPAGAPPSAYRELIPIIRGQGALPFLDASGEALRLGLEAMPSFFKPNEDEIAQLLGTDAGDEAALVQAIRGWMAQGFPCVVVSLGASGAIAGYAGNCYRIAAPKIEPVNTVGCGDAFTAGMAVGFARGLPAEDIFRLATAAGSANALTRQPGDVRSEDVARLLGEVRVTMI